MFSWEICQISKNTFSTEHVGATASRALFLFLLILSFVVAEAVSKISQISYKTHVFDTLLIKALQAFLKIWRSF